MWRFLLVLLVCLVVACIIEPPLSWFRKWSIDKLFTFLEWRKEWSKTRKEAKLARRQAPYHHW